MKDKLPVLHLQPDYILNIMRERGLPRPAQDDLERIMEICADRLRGSRRLWNIYWDEIGNEVERLRAEDQKK